jgi:hypothetical protein
VDQPLGRDPGACGLPHPSHEAARLPNPRVRVCGTVSAGHGYTGAVTSELLCRYRVGGGDPGGDGVAAHDGTEQGRDEEQTADGCQGNAPLLRARAGRTGSSPAGARLG